MNLKKAILTGLLAYALSFAAGIITLLILRIDPSTGTDIPNSAYIIGMFTSVLITVFCANLYFKGEKTSAEEGFKFGTIIIAVSFLIDMFFFTTYTLTTAGTSQTVVDYYTNVYFWLTLVLVFITSALVGHFKRKGLTLNKRRRKKR
ncbi:MAG: hypothetical protein AABX51_08065 [Nanoarchaeota archaeon]